MPESKAASKQSSADQGGEKVVELPLAELRPFKNHPFKVKDDDAMMETAESIRQYGVLVPAIARPSPEGGYEIIAGHRRHRASELAEKETMPVIIRDLDDCSLIGRSGKKHWGSWIWSLSRRRSAIAAKLSLPIRPPAPMI